MLKKFFLYFFKIPVPSTSDVMATPVKLIPAGWRQDQSTAALADLSKHRTRIDDVEWLDCLPSCLLDDVKMGLCSVEGGVAGQWAGLDAVTSGVKMAVVHTSTEAIAGSLRLDSPIAVGALLSVVAVTGIIAVTESASLQV
ncbi:hypothetical protein Trydic_g1502 [Trypoxylus dichotomus]